MKGGSEPAIRLYWLGHPRVEQCGRELRLETRKTTALLAYLTMSEHTQSREKLAALFWPQFDSIRAPANLRRSLASLHASIPGDWLVAERDRIGVKRESSLWIDLVAAREQLAAARAHCGTSGVPCPACLELVNAALGLFGGDFLEGFNLPDCPEFDDWQTFERQSVRDDLAWLLERAARGEAAAGRWEESLRLSKRWLALDPLHEPACALVMEILARAGQRSAAVRQYERFAEELAAEFGQEPEEATRELYNRILSRELEPKAAAEESGAADNAARAPEPLAGVLATKLAIPPLRAGMVRRLRLTSLLKEGLARGLILVSAPAGFGKTTMLSELAAQASMPVAWLSLDESDNDIRRFLLHLATAIARAAEGVGEGSLQMLRALPPAPADVVMTGLINAVEEHGASIALVLDDYQFIRSPEVHAAMRLLIDHRPAPLSVILATREDPPFPLARLRSQDRLAEIRVEELRFTSAEAGQFLGSVMALSLSAEQVSVLERRTEGWVAGLQMAALSLKGREDVEGFLASFSGTHRFILDYLAEEVFSRQDGEITRFLLDTSILARMSAGLCEAVTQRGGCSEILHRIEQMNLFLVPLDEERSWYRYHHLFADLLHHRLRLERTPEEIAALELRAADWFADQGELVEAVQAYLAARAYERAADLIEGQVYEILSRGALSELQRWCAEIPSEVREKRLGYRIASAWTLAWAGRRGEAEVLLGEIEALVRERKEGGGGASGVMGSDRLATLDGTVATIRAILADMAGETEQAVNLASEAKRLLTPSDAMQRTVDLYILAKSHLYRGELVEAEEGYQEFLRASEAAGSIWSISAAVVELAHLRSIQGCLRDEEKLLEGFDALAARRHARDIGPIAKAYSLLADIRRERGDLEGALRMAQAAARRAEAWGLPSDVYLTNQFLARMLRSCGRPEEAREALERVRSLPERALVFRMLLPSFEAERVRTFLACGDLESAEAWIREYAPGKSDTPVNREIELCTLARVRLASGVTPAALLELCSFLGELAGEARAGGRRGPLLAILLLLARAEGLRGEEARALEALHEAVRIAQPEGYLRLFVEEGPQLFELLARGQELGRWDAPPLSAYVGGLLRAFTSVV